MGKAKSRRGKKNGMRKWEGGFGGIYNNGKQRKVREGRRRRRRKVCVQCKGTAKYGKRYGAHNGVGANAAQHSALAKKKVFIWFFFSFLTFIFCRKMLTRYDSVVCLFICLFPFGSV